MESHSELVGRVAETFFSVNHTVTGELKLEGEFFYVLVTALM